MPASPAWERLRARFAKHAVTPEHAAACIVRRVERDHCMVYTSADIRMGQWLEVMRRLNREFDEALAARGTPS